MAGRSMPRGITSLFAVAAVLALQLSTLRASSDKPLELPQKMQLKDAASLLDQAGALADTMEKEAASWKAADAEVPAERVREVLAARDKAVQHLRDARELLGKLPEKHADVAPELKRHEELVRRVVVAAKRAEAAEKLLAGVADQGRSPQFKLDFDRLREINLMLMDPMVLQARPRDAVEVVRLVAPMKAERKRIGEKYADLLKQDTPEAEQLRSALRQSEQTFGEFERAVTAHVNAAPAEIDAAIDEAMKLARQGVAEGKPAVFAEGNAVQQRVQAAEQRLAVLAAADPDGPAAKNADAKVRKLKSDLAEAAKSLRGDIVAVNRVPDESFAGPDAEVLRGVVKQKWTSEGTGGPVLKVGLCGQGWRRDTRWEWNRVSGAFEKVDRSRAQGYVVVPLDANTAAVHHLALVKDHLAADAITAAFVESPKAAPDAGRVVLLKNVK